MIQQTREINDFKIGLYDSLQLEGFSFPTIRFAKPCHVYVCGDSAETIYFIESGQVKLHMPSSQGKECLLALYTAGDIFGELCLEGSIRRQETATVMEDTTLKGIPRSKLFLHLSRYSLLESFVQYLAARLAEQQHVMGTLLTVDSEHRLGETLLALARKLGQPDPRSTRIEQKITHEQLSEMVGTTRPRITEFMRKFRELGLIRKSQEHFLIVNEEMLADYLARNG